MVSSKSAWAVEHIELKLGARTERYLSNITDRVGDLIPRVHNPWLPQVQRQSGDQQHVQAVAGSRQDVNYSNSSHREMDNTTILQQHRPRKPKTTDEDYSTFTRAFQDLHALSCYNDTHCIRSIGSRKIDVHALPQRISEWFRWFNCSTIENQPELNWSSPLRCIADLQPSYSFTSESTHTRGDTTGIILSDDQACNLLHLFQEKYSGWLGFAVIEEAHDPLLSFVCCTLAARHLPDDVRWFFVPRLQAVTEEMIKMIISGPPSLTGSFTTVKALFIWAVWLPVTRNRYGSLAQDPRAVLSLALNMAYHLGLSGCAQRLFKIRELQAAGHPIDVDLAADLLDKARLWGWITNMDIMYSLRTGRPLHSSHGPCFVSVFPVTSTVPTHPDGFQDSRIRITADLLHATETALKIQPHSNSSGDLECWLRERRRCLRDLANLQRILALFGPLADFVKCHFSHMGVSSRTAQLLVYYDVLYTAWKLYEASPKYEDNPNNPFWCLEIDPSLVDWMKEGLVLAEEILLWVVQVDSEFLVPMPDHLFLFFSFAAIYVTGVKLIASSALQVVPTSVECRLFGQAISNLNRAAVWSGHPAKSCADFMTALLSLWDNKDMLFTGDG
ncbi:hypothetical protein Moror_8393 [Moniliophthora roreri MCA 2997]|uniref:Transcription factor domain-containing protein n=1 Tax=Moniliophthora roreri (strain MCA 2997) TaxID=1381753 RepID=V2X4X8_MONRO|nr:hypothetical protein Moror_8393 [Moniliophthora roreri MCA 2997]